MLVPWASLLIGLAAFSPASCFASVVPSAPVYDTDTGGCGSTPTSAFCSTAVHVIRSAWESYRTQCWGRDELKPASHACSGNGNWLDQGMTIVDSLDTLWLAGLDSQVEAGIGWIEGSLTFRPDEDAGDDGNTISVFEATIRFLGGLLSAYEVTGQRHEVLLNHAHKLGTLLLPAFDTPSGLPYGLLNLKTQKGSNRGWFSGSPALLAEVGTFAVEYLALAGHTNDNSFVKKIRRVLNVLQTAPVEIAGLYPLLIDVDSGMFTQQDGEFKVSAGPLGDSFYEYLLKSHIMLRQSSVTTTRDMADSYKKMYLESADMIVEVLSQTYTNAAEEAYRRKHNPQATPHYLAMLADITFSPETSLDGDAGPLPQRRFVDKTTNRTTYLNVDLRMNQLACFVPGMLALGIMTGVVEEPAKRAAHHDAAVALMDTCVIMYLSTETHLAGEVYGLVREDSEGENTMNAEFKLDGDSSYRLRPETVESLFYLWCLTGEAKWVEAAETIFAALVEHCCVGKNVTEASSDSQPWGHCPLGYSGLKDVTKLPRDAMERAIKDVVQDKLYRMNTISSRNYGGRWHRTAPRRRRFDWKEVRLGAFQEVYTDRMESFFLAETLKYLLLLFHGDTNEVCSAHRQVNWAATPARPAQDHSRVASLVSRIAAGEMVFNTEAHPLLVLH